MDIFPIFFSLQTLSLIA